MRWSEISEGPTADVAAEKSAAERRRQQQIAKSLRARSEAARKYQDDMRMANDKLSAATKKKS